MSKQKKKSKTIIIIFLVIALIVAGVVGFIIYSKISDDINGKNQSSTKYTLVIEKNDFEYQVAEKLANNGMIVNSTVWISWMDKNYPDFEYTNGEYYMTADMSYDEIVAKLQNPDISHKSVKVCIPEGTNIMQISKILEENGICSASEFLEVCRSTDGYDYDFLDSVPDTDVIGYKLEGFLFPATYDMGMNSEPKDIACQMLDAFEEHITSDMKNFCTKHNMTLFQLITLSSIVQEEALGVSSAKNIASVFMNRLEKGAKLESDVTYYYARDLRDYYGFSQEVYDAYYTYRCPALPAGPISNCGDDIIDAVVNYPTTNYLYFFSDLQQEFHFASTSEEFYALQKQYPWQ